jgi:hypothetical protein
VAQRTLTHEEILARNDYREAARIERMFERMRTADERQDRQREYDRERQHKRQWLARNAALSRRKLTPVYCRCFADRRY